MIIPGKRNLICNQGGRFDAVFRFRAKATPTSTPEIIPLEGKAARVQVRKSVASEVLTEFSETDGSLVIDFEESTITLYKGATVTANFTPGIYIYSLEIFDPANSEDSDPYMRGQFRVDGESTHG